MISDLMLRLLGAFACGFFGGWCWGRATAFRRYDTTLRRRTP